MNARADLALPTELAFFDSPSCLVYGIGNDGRQDDGLGWAFIDRIEDGLAAEFHRAYQLNLEDADLINRFTRVLFVDATRDPAVSSFELTRPEPRLDVSFTSHALSVGTLLATAERCFDRTPDAYLLAIRGYQWELETGLTEAAERNLRRALESLAG